jgi:hypothetical protein
MGVHSRRWFCDVPTCQRKNFAERFDGVPAQLSPSHQRHHRRADDVRTASWW